MENIKQNINGIREVCQIDKAYIFGSYLDAKNKSNDIDVILYKANGVNKYEIDMLLSNIPISRIQYNCYKNQDKGAHSGEFQYDIVIIDEPFILRRFLDINRDRIIEI